MFRYQLRPKLLDSPSYKYDIARGQLCKGGNNLFRPYLLRMSHSLYYLVVAV